VKSPNRGGFQLRDLKPAIFCIIPGSGWDFVRDDWHTEYGRSLRIKLHSLQIPGLATVLAMLFLIAFGIKAAMFPLFFWLPASYHTPPVAVSALFAGLLTKVGVYSLIRVFTLLFLEDVNFTHNLILVVAGLTMVTGVLGAVAQYDFRRCYPSISSARSVIS
jgi:formate hydrogenlyase subunit 3/multisubunit Na+/H+ antiporter MnhD subunit